MARVAPYLFSFMVSMWFSLESTEATLAWPAGTYGLPKAKVGCPVSPKTKWTTGWRFEDTEDSNPGNTKSPSFHLDAVVGADINTTFCMKIKDKETTEWPQGQYCIFKKGVCPKNFQEGYVFWDDENYKNINKKGGTLPDGVYDEDTKIYYCCRTDGNKLTPVLLPVISPFYLKAFNASECQRVEGAVATEEFIRFDNEDSGNKDKQNGSHPHGAGIHNHRLSYCYYESCQYTYSLDSGQQMEFTSPKFFGEGYPRAQKCTWRFIAPEKNKVHIDFLEVDIEEGDSIAIHSGWDHGASLGSITKRDSPNPNGYVAETVLFMEFLSSRKPSKGFRGIFKVIPSKESPSSALGWPTGTFGLPRPKLGCPPSNNVTWSTGWRFQDTEDKDPKNFHSDSFHMDASVMKNDMNRSFCIATKNKGSKAWPKGQYCIYKKGACPKGLTEGYIFFDDENDKNQNSLGGVLPDGVYNENTKLFYCCRTDGDKLAPISLPVSSPFYLMAYNTSECQRVNGALAVKEYIRFDNEDTKNKDTRNGTQPYQRENVIITYCYYQACHFTISEKSQEFMSPYYLSDGFPNSEFCTWRFLVQKKTPPTEQVLIKFPEFHLQKGADRDVVRIYSGWDDKAPLLAEFNGNKPPPAKGVASKSSVVYVVFRSDSRGQSRGFRGLFLNQRYSASDVPTKPITLPPFTLPKTIKPTNQTLNVSTSPTNNKIAAQAKQTGTQSVPINVIIPVVIAIILVVALVSSYFIRRKRMENRVQKALSRSQTQLVNNSNSAYHDLNSQEFESTEELQEIFPLG